jgi:DNA-cytosine methyltransferase
VANTQKIRVVELFAGVGGFRVGLEACSPHFETVWASQWEPGQAGQWAYKCYCQRFGEKANCSNEDIASVINDVPEHDLLVGGFPCQDYSVAHTGAQGIEGKKGVLWWSIDKIIKLRNPKFVLLENVDRLLKSPAKQRGRDFGIILRCLNDEGYCVEWRVINAADYGNAQRRRRVFIFATRRDTYHFGFNTKVTAITDAFKESAFEWISPDGTSIVMMNTNAGYGEATALPQSTDDFDEIIDYSVIRRKGLENRIKDLQDLRVPRSDSEHILWLNGIDHSFAQPDLYSVIQKINDAHH